MKNKISLHLAGMALTWCALVGCQSAPFADRTGFESPELAIDALIVALRAEDLSSIESVLGPDCGALLDSGDEVEDREGRQRFLELYDESHFIESTGDGVSVLYIGEMQWPFPIPLVQEDGRWFLDTAEGAEELIARRIGQNELAAMAVCQALVDAQLDYASTDWDGDGLFEYARKIRSAANSRDGLYWESSDESDVSPVGVLLAEAERSSASVPEEREPFHGYYFKLLEAQGTHARGGAYSYLAGERMIGGFAFLATPARYGESGIMSFLVSHDRVIYEADLGPDTESAAAGISTFDPDEAWSEVSEE